MIKVHKEKNVLRQPKVIVHQLDPNNDVVLQESVLKFRKGEKYVSVHAIKTDGEIADVKKAFLGKSYSTKEFCKDLENYLNKSMTAIFSGKKKPFLGDINHEINLQIENFLNQKKRVRKLRIIL